MPMSKEGDLLNSKEKFDQLIMFRVHRTGNASTTYRNNTLTVLLSYYIHPLTFRSSDGRLVKNKYRIDLNRNKSVNRRDV